MAEPMGLPLKAAFAEGNSFLHTMDPRLKVFLAAALALAAATVSNWSSLGALLAFSILLLFLGRIPLSSVMKRLALLDGLIIVLWVTLPLWGGGERVSLGICSLSIEGVVMAGMITLRSHTAVFGFTSLLGTTPIYRTMNALKFFHMPEKLVLLLHFTYRYAHVFFDEASKLHRSMALRAFKPGFNLRTLRAYGNLMGMILLKAFNRAERVSAAMKLRGFNGTFPNICSVEKLSLAQVACCAGLGLLLLGCVLI
ncbi:MAG: cobalt/nickel transport system permease protein [Synergistaceae bacterium]|nr:cobalt/nickel transport system permease protein [Synergistaceae bacterium]